MVDKKLKRELAIVIIEGVILGLSVGYFLAKIIYKV